MSRIAYSGGSFKFEKLLACFGALRALYLEAKATITVNSAMKEGDEGLQLLRSKPSSFSSMQFCFSTTTGPVEVDFREVWDLFIVEITGLSKKDEGSVHDIIRGT